GAVPLQIEEAGDQLARRALRQYDGRVCFEGPPVRLDHSHRTVCVWRGAETGGPADLRPEVLRRTVVRANRRCRPRVPRLARTVFRVAQDFRDQRTRRVTLISASCDVSPVVVVVVVRDTVDVAQRVTGGGVADAG